MRAYEIRPPTDKHGVDRIFYCATEPVGLSLLEHESRLTIALTTAADNKQNAVFLDIAEARKNCSGNPAERHNI
jgi:hypothetical protein